MSDDCIEHDQIGVGMGYGTTTVNGKTVRWHRLVYCERVGCTLDDIKGLVVRHKCDNARCLNPDHLELGTHQDNMDDKTKRGRNAKGSKLSTKLTEADVAYIRKHYKPHHRIYGGVPMMRKFNIASRTLYYILDGSHWRP